MPRAQVYGKRSRAVYDSFAIFDSPQRPTTLKPTNAEEKETQRLVEKVMGVKLDEFAQGIADGRRRSVLGEIDVNSAVNTVLPTKKARKPKAKKAATPVMVEVEVGDIEGLHVKEPGSRDKNAAQAIEDAANTERGRVGSGSDEVEQAENPSPCPGVNQQANVEVDEERPEDEQAGDQPCVDAVGCDPISEDIAESEAPGWDLGIGMETLTIAEGPTIGEATQIDTYVASNVSTLPSSLVIPDAVSEHCSQLLELSSHRLTQFDSWADLLADHFSLGKIAEASFGEVYRLSLLEQLPGLSASDESVFKVIALQQPAANLPTAKKARAAALKKAEAMSKPDDVANEVKLLQRMSSIPGFTNFRDVRVLQGRPPPLFAAAFKQYNAEQKAMRKEVSHFPDPAKKNSYSEDQLWAVIEMQDAGTDLERLVESRVCTSVWSVWDVFWQVVLSLAKGEEGAQFEHRDLHLGNICVRHRSQLARPGAVDTKKKLGFTDLETTIIDYTISRCLLSAPVGRKADQDVAYHDLSLDNYLFEGDSTEEYQYDIYRYMRGAVYHADPMSNNPNPSAKPKHHRSPVTPWRDYTPITNLVWLHYLLHQLLEQLDWPSARKAPARKLKGGAAHAEWKRANDLEHKLLKVQTLLDPETGICKNGLRSATDIVGLALTEGWLDVADVVGANGADDAETEPGLVNDEAAVPSSDALAEELTHLVINIDVMEERGLEAAEQEALSRRRRSEARRKG